MNTYDITIDLSNVRNKKSLFEKFNQAFFFYDPTIPVNNVWDALQDNLRNISYDIYGPQKGLPDIDLVSLHIINSEELKESNPDLYNVLSEILESVKSMSHNEDSEIKHKFDYELS